MSNKCVRALLDKDTLLNNAMNTSSGYHHFLTYDPRYIAKYSNTFQFYKIQKLMTLEQWLRDTALIGERARPSLIVRSDFRVLPNNGNAAVVGEEIIEPPNNESADLGEGEVRLDLGELFNVEDAAVGVEMPDLGVIPGIAYNVGSLRGERMLHSLIREPSYHRPNPIKQGFFQLDHTLFLHQFWNFMVAFSTTSYTLYALARLAFTISVIISLNPFSYGLETYMTNCEFEAIMKCAGAGISKSNSSYFSL